MTISDLINRLTEVETEHGGATGVIIEVNTDEWGPLQYSVGVGHEEGRCVLTPELL